MFSAYHSYFYVSDFRIVLLREVPILQSREERLDFEKKYHGKSDIVFSYQQAIGTYGQW